MPPVQSEALAAALKNVGAKVELVEFRGHGNGLLDREEVQPRLRRQLNRFLDHTIRTLPAGAAATTGIVYASPGGRDLRLDLYAPAARAKDLLPAVIFLHGGGWLWGSRSDVGLLAARVASRGFITATVEYRLAQERIYPAAVDDAKAAVRWIRANASRYGVDPGAIGVSGISAGGHLAALLAVTNDRRYFLDADRYREKSAEVQAAAPIAGVVDMAAQNERDLYSPAIFLGSTPNERPELWRDASPIHHVSPSAAPFLFLHGTEDALVAIEEAREMARRLRAVGVTADVYAAEGGDHDFIQVPPWRDLAFERLITLLSQTLKNRP